MLASQLEGLFEQVEKLALWLLLLLVGHQVADLLIAVQVVHPCLVRTDSSRVVDEPLEGRPDLGMGPGISSMRRCAPRPRRGTQRSLARASARLMMPSRYSSMHCAATPTPPAGSARAASTRSWQASMRAASWPPASSQSKTGWRTGAGPLLQKLGPEI